MAKPTENLMDLIQEAKALSDHIAVLKRKANVIDPGPERDQLRKDIKMKQYQALFYIEKMGNLKKEGMRKYE